MHINLEKLKYVFSSRQEIDFLYDYLYSFYNGQTNTNSIKYETLKELKFVTTHKKKDIVNLENIKSHSIELYKKVLNDLLSKYIYIDSDNIELSDEELTEQFENETEEDFIKKTEKLNVLDSNHELLIKSLYSRSLEKFKIIEIKNKKATISKDFRFMFDNFTNSPFVTFIKLSLIMLEENGEEYNPTIVEYLKSEKIINE